MNVTILPTPQAACARAADVVREVLVAKPAIALDIYALNNLLLGKNG